MTYWDEKKQTRNVWLSIADLLNAEGDVVNDSAEYVSDEGAKLCKLVKKGTLLVSFKLTLGRLAYTGRDLFTNEAIAALTLKDCSLSKEYLFWYLRHYDWEKAAKGDEKVKGKTLNKAKLQLLPVIVPPLSEQQRIVGILDEAFAAIATAKANTAKSRDNARTVFASASDAILAGCKEATPRRLEEVAASDCTLSYGIVQPGDEQESGLIIVRPVDLGPKYIRAAGLKRIDPSRARAYVRTRLQGNELLLCVRGTTGTVGVATDELKDGNVTRGLVPIRFNPAIVRRAFGYYLMKCDSVQNQIRAKTYGAALMQINIKDVRDLIVRIPSLSEQDHAVQTLDVLERDTQRLESLAQQKLDALDALKKSLLHQAFTGQLIDSSDKRAVATA